VLYAIIIVLLIWTYIQDKVINRLTGTLHYYINKNNKNECEYINEKDKETYIRTVREIESIYK